MVKNRGGIRLKRYLKIHKITQSEAAEALPCNATSLSRIINGRFRPRIELALAIYEFTNGFVTLKDFVDDVDY